MKYKTYKVVGGGEFVRGIPETDEDRALVEAQVKAGIASVGDVWDRKERERAHKYGLKLEAEKKAAWKKQAEEEARRKSESESKNSEEGT